MCELTVLQKNSTFCSRKNLPLADIASAENFVIFRTLLRNSGPKPVPSTTFYFANMKKTVLDLKIRKVFLHTEGVSYKSGHIHLVL